MVLLKTAPTNLACNLEAPPGAGAPTLSLRIFFLCNGDSTAAGASSALPRSSAGHSRRIQLPVDGRHLRPSQAFKSSASDVDELRNFSRKLFPTLCLDVSARAGIRSGDGRVARQALGRRAVNLGRQGGRQLLGV